MPKRIQLRRAKGWRMPENTVKVDRSTKLGNPFIVGEDGTRAECAQHYAMLLAGHLCLTCRTPIERQKAALDYFWRHVEQLRGHDLACWCSLDGPCHANVQLQLANAPIAEKTEA